MEEEKFKEELLTVLKNYFVDFPITISEEEQNNFLYKLKKTPTIENLKEILFNIGLPDKTIQKDMEELKEILRKIPKKYNEKNEEKDISSKNINVEPFLNITIEKLTEKSTETEINEILEKIYNVTPILQDKTIDKITKKTKIKKSVIKNQLAKIINSKESVIKDYYLKKSRAGYYFKMIGDKGAIFDLALFDNIEKQNCNTYDIESDSSHIKMRFQVILDKNSTYPKTQENLNHSLKNSLLAPKYKSFLNENMFDCFFDEVNKLKEVEINMTNVFGFYKGIYHDYPEWEAYTKIVRKEGSRMINEEEAILPAQWYINFLKLKVDEEKKKECIKILNENYCRSEEEKYAVKITLAFSVASVCKFIYHFNNINIHPIFVLIGEKESGKTTACRIFLRYIWNKPELTKQHLEGRKGSRLKQFIGDCFPLYVDEANTFGKIMEELKCSTTSLGLKITRGDQSQSEITWTLHSNLSTSCNDYHIDDPALAQRHIIQQYPNFKEKIDNTEHSKYLNENIKYLGKAIYDKIGNFDFEKNISELREKYKEYSYRDLDKILYIKTAEKILNDMEILKDIDIDAKKIIEQNAFGLTDEKDIVLDIIHDVIRNCKFQRQDRNLITIERIISDKEIDINSFTEFARQGIYISRDFENIVLGREVISEINKRFERKQIPLMKNSIEELAKKIEMQTECITHSIIKNNIEILFDRDAGYMKMPTKKIVSTKFGIKFSTEKLVDTSIDSINNKGKEGKLGDFNETT